MHHTARDALVQQVQFDALLGQMADYGLYALLAPHIANRGQGNHGWAGEYKGIPMLFAERAGTTLALACSVPFRAMSCGYVGVSDGWQDISRHKRLAWGYPQAPDGNIALTGQIDLAACDGRFTLVVAFGRNAAEAGQRARATLLHDGDEIVKRYVQGWQAYQAQCLDLGSPDGGVDLYRISVAVVKAHAATRFPGGLIASLSIPWGAAKGDDDLGGYHLVWPRDLVEAAGGLLAAGDAAPARAVLFNGRPTGAAMPLVWAHAEYIKLTRSLCDGQVFDLPPQPVQRYQVDQIASRLAIWRFNQKCRWMVAGKTLRVETLAAARVRWSPDGWCTVYDTPTHDTGLGVHVADLPTTDLPPDTMARFTFFWPGADRWEGVDFEVLVERDDDLAADHVWITPGL